MSNTDSDADQQSPALSDEQVLCSFCLRPSSEFNGVCQSDDETVSICLPCAQNAVELLLKLEHQH